MFGTKNAILFRTESEFCSEQNRSFVPNTLFRTFSTNGSEQDFFVVPNKLFGTVRNKVFRTRCSEHFTQTVPNRIFLLFRTNCLEQTVRNKVFGTVSIFFFQTGYTEKTVVYLNFTSKVDNYVETFT